MRAQQGTAPSRASSGIVTSEAVELAFETAGVATRVLARLIDAILIGFGLIAVMLLQAWAQFAPIAWLQVLLGFFLYGTVLLGYPVAFETLNAGRTPGKAAMGLRVVTRSGGPARLRHAMVRAAIGIVEVVMLFGVPALISVFVTARNQRVGDLAAGTIVVRERLGAKRAEATRFAADPRWAPYVEVLDVSRVAPQEYALVRSAILRARDVKGPGAVVGAEQVAGRLTPLVSPPPPAGMDAMSWLACVAVAVQRRSDHTAAARANAAVSAAGGATFGAPAGGWGAEATTRLSATAPSAQRQVVPPDVHGLRPPA